MADDPRQTDLDARIASARGVRAARPAGRPADKGYRQGSRVLAELVGAPIGGGLIGWLLDRWLGTSPWILLALVALSFVVAFRNIYRISQEKPE